MAGLTQNITMAEKYLPLLDEVYKASAKTSILDGDEVTVQKAGHGKLKVAKLNMDGLGDFSRSSGYTRGATTLTWEDVAYDKERSADLRIDRLDNEEALGIAFAKLSSEFLRTKVVPETDASRFAKIAGTTGISKKSEALSTGADVVSALRTAINKLDEDEVDAENRILFITPTLRALVDDLDTTKSRAVWDRFATIVEVPQTRFYTAITLNDGTTDYGYAKDSASGKNINFLCVQKSAVVTAMDQYIKYFTPDEDQNGDDNVFKYRNNNLYGHVYANKVAGVYCSYSTT